MQTEKRKTARFETGTAALLIQHHGDSSNAVFCRNISISGICVLLRQTIPVGSLCTIKLLLQNDQHLINTTQVIWQSRLKDPKKEEYIMGLRFLSNNGHQNGLDETTLTTIVSRQVKLLDKQTDEQREEQSILTRWRFPEKKFICHKRIFLKHTNMEGNTYYDNYVAWHGEAREALLLSHPNVRDLLKPENAVKMITHSLHQRYIQDTFFGDSVRIEVTSREVKACSFTLVFRYYNQENTLVGEGWQKICFADPRTGKICRTPELILDLIEPIQE